MALARSEEDATLRRALPIALLLSAGGLLVLGLAGARLPVVLIVGLVAGIGFALTLIISGGNVLLQHSVPEALRGRVMGLFVMSFNGAAPLGALGLGLIADWLGVSTALTLSGASAGFAVLSRHVGIRR